MHVFGLLTMGSGGPDRQRGHDKGKNAKEKISAVPWSIVLEQSWHRAAWSSRRRSNTNGTVMVPTLDMSLLVSLLDTPTSHAIVPLFVVLTCARPMHPMPTITVTAALCDEAASATALGAADELAQELAVWRLPRRGEPELSHASQFPINLNVTQADASAFPVADMQLSTLPALLIFSQLALHVVSSPWKLGVSDWASAVHLMAERFIEGTLPVWRRTGLSAAVQPAWSLRPRVTTTTTLDYDLVSPGCALLVVFNSHAEQRKNVTERPAARWRALAEQWQVPSPLRWLQLDLAHNDLPKTQIGAYLEEKLIEVGLPAFLAVSRRTATPTDHRSALAAASPVSLAAVPARRVRSTAALHQWAAMHIKTQCKASSRNPSTDSYAWLRSFVDDGVPLLVDGLQTMMRRRLDVRVQQTAMEVTSPSLSPLTPPHTPIVGLDPYPSRMHSPLYKVMQERQQELELRASIPAEARRVMMDLALTTEWQQVNDAHVRRLIDAALAKGSTDVAEGVHGQAGAKIEVLLDDVDQRLGQLHSAQRRLAAANALHEEQAQAWRLLQ